MLGDIAKQLFGIVFFALRSCWLLDCRLRGRFLGRLVGGLGLVEAQVVEVLEQVGGLTCHCRCSPPYCLSMLELMIRAQTKLLSSRGDGE